MPFSIFSRYLLPSRICMENAPRGVRPADRLWKYLPFFGQGQTFFQGVYGKGMTLFGNCDFCGEAPSVVDLMITEGFGDCGEASFLESVLR